VISAAERSYKDAMRDAETLLRCEPVFADKAVDDENWIDVRWEWVDVCEKILVCVCMRSIELFLICGFRERVRRRYRPSICSRRNLRLRRS